MLFEYLDYINYNNKSNETQFSREIYKKLNKLDFKCVNGVFNKKEINCYKRKVIEWDIFINNEINEIFYIKTPLCKLIKNEYPWLTFELCNAYDNIQVNLFECILKQLKNKFVDKKSKNNTFEPFIYRNYEKKFITIKFIENYSKCYLRNNHLILDIQSFFSNFEDKNYIICMGLHKKWIDIENCHMGLEWNIYQIKSLNIEPEIVDFNIQSVSLLNVPLNIIPIPIPPPPPPVFDMNRHKITIKKTEIVDNIKKNLPNSNIVVPSLSDIQNILDKMKKKKFPN